MSIGKQLRPEERGSTNLAVLLREAADSFGDRVLVGSGSGGLTAGELEKAALRGSQVIVDAGASCLIYADQDGVGLAVALFAAAHAGVPLLPVTTPTWDGAAGDPFTPLEPAIVVGDLAGAVRAPKETQVLSGVRWREITFAGPASAPRIPEVRPVAGDPPAVVINTPGVVAAPKRVVLRHSHLTTYAMNTALDEGMVGPEEVELLSLPLSEPVALTHLVRNIYAGRRSVFLERLDPDLWLETARKEYVTSALVVPPLLARIVGGGDRARSAADKAVPSLRTLEYGGAPMPPTVMQKARSTWPHLNFLNEYWLAETSSTITRLTESDYQSALRSRDVFVRARLGSVGRPLAHTNVEIRNGHDDVLEPGERGRIWVKGPHVSAEYLGSAPLLDAGGFFDTGDDGFVDEDGYLYLEGRSDQTIRRAGERIAPETVEAVLAQHPAVADVAVVGFSVPDSDQRMVAVVVLRGSRSASPSELHRFAAARLRPGRVPDEFIFATELPRTQTGKLLRRHVSVQVAADLG